MKLKIAAILAIALGTGLVSACNNSHHAGTMPATSTVQMLDTTQVLALARQTTETGTPFAVADGKLVLTDTSETSEPVSINAM